MPPWQTRLWEKRINLISPHSLLLFPTLFQYLRLWTVLIGVLVFDQWSKAWVVNNALELRRNPIVVIDGLEGPQALLEFTYITNPGAAWSLFSDYPEALTLLAMVALMSIFFFRKQLELHRHSLQLIFGSICGGIAGNLGDRLFREPAEVVDFIDVFLPLVEYDYPIFNVADSAIFIGAFSYLFIGFLDSKKLKASNQPTG